MVGDVVETNVFVEGRLKFKFPKHWSVVKYDDPQGFYKTELKQIQMFQGVDFLILKENVLTLVEVKEFQGDQTELARKIRLTSGGYHREALDNVVVQKTRDTILGLLLA